MGLYNSECPLALVARETGPALVDLGGNEAIARLVCRNGPGYVGRKCSAGEGSCQETNGGRDGIHEKGRGPGLAFYSCITGMGF